MFDEDPTAGMSGPPAKISVTMESFDTHSLYQDVVRQMAATMLGEQWHENSLRRDVAAAVSAEVQTRLDIILTDGVAHLLSREIQQRDAFGEKVGEGTNISAIVASAGATYLTEMVDSDGKPSRSGYGNRKSRIEWLVEKVVTQQLDALIREEAKALRAALEQKAKAAAAAVLAGVRI